MLAYHHHDNAHAGYKLYVTGSQITVALYSTCMCTASPTIVTGCCPSLSLPAYAILVQSAWQ